jgi:hypothetical protein
MVHFFQVSSEGSIARRITFCYRKEANLSQSHISKTFPVARGIIFLRCFAKDPNHKRYLLDLAVCLVYIPLFYIARFN